MEAIERLKEMVDKPFLYHNEEVVILSYVDGVGYNCDDVEIMLNNGKTIECNITNIDAKLSQFRPIDKYVVALANDRMNKASTINANVLLELRDTVLKQIRLIQENPDNIKQATAVFNGISQITNLAKTELEIKKYLDKQPAIVLPQD